MKVVTRRWIGHEDKKFCEKSRLVIEFFKLRFIPRVARASSHFGGARYSHDPHSYISWSQYNLNAASEFKVDFKGDSVQIRIPVL